MTVAWHKSDYEISKNTPYLAPTVELSGFFSEYLGEKILYYKKVHLKFCHTTDASFPIILHFSYDK